MLLVKVLENKFVIRAFGVCLLLAPIGNNLVTMSMLPAAPDRWSLMTFWVVVLKISFMNQALYAASIVIGILMLRGATSAWRYTLGLLGVRLIWQMFNLTKDFKESKLTGVIFLVNLALFLFIADQLVWKQKVKARAAERTPPPKPEPRPLQRKHAEGQKVLVDFEGFGTWAQVLNITEAGIEVRALKKPDFEIGERTIEVSLKNGLTFRAKLKSQSGEKFFFEYVALENQDVHRLNQWMRQTAAA